MRSLKENQTCTFFSSFGLKSVLKTQMPIRSWTCRAQGDKKKKKNNHGRYHLPPSEVQLPRNRGISNKKFCPPLSFSRLSLFDLASNLTASVPLTSLKLSSNLPSLPSSPCLPPASQSVWSLIFKPRAALAWRSRCSIASPPSLNTGGEREGLGGITWSAGN